MGLKKNQKNDPAPTALDSARERGLKEAVACLEMTAAGGGADGGADKAAAGPAPTGAG